MGVFDNLRKSCVCVCVSEIFSYAFFQKITMRFTKNA